MQPQSELLGLKVGKLKAKGPLNTVQAQVELPAHSQVAGSWSALHCLSGSLRMVWLPDMQHLH
jgi:hypothetical protein